MIKVVKWLKYVSLFFIALSIIVILYFFNSTATIQWAMDRYAPQYGVGYKHISGSLLTGIEIEALTYKENRLSDRLKIHWNPLTIFYNRITISDLEVIGLDVDHTQEAVEEYLPKESQGEVEEANNLPFSIEVSDLHLTLKPFNKDAVHLKKVLVNAEDLAYNDNDIDIGNFSILLESNVSSVKLKGEIQDKQMILDNLSLLDIDTMALDSIIKKTNHSDFNAHSDAEDYQAVENNRTDKENLFIRGVLIDSAKVRFKPAEFPSMTLHQGEINASAIKVDMDRMIDLLPNAVQIGVLSAFVDTNLSRFTMQSKLENEVITVDALSLRDIDTMALIEIFSSVNTDHKIDSTGTEHNTTLPLALPKTLYLNQMDIAIKSLKEDTFLLNNGELNATNVSFDIPSLRVESGDIELSIISNLVSLQQQGLIKNNQMKSHGDIMVHQALLDTYDLPMSDLNFKSVNLDLMANEDEAVLNFDLKKDAVNWSENDVLNIQDLSLGTHVTYNISNSVLNVVNHGKLSTANAKEIDIHNIVTLNDEGLNYKGVVTPDRFENVDSNFSRILDGFQITYEGNMSGIEALIDSRALKGRFVSDDFKTGRFTLFSKEDFIPQNIFQLPQALQPSYIDFSLDVPLDFENIIPIHASAKIASNLVDLDVKMIYDDEYSVTSKLIVPEDSLLREYSNELNFDAISPVYMDLSTKGKNLYAITRSKRVNNKAKLDMESNYLEGKLNIGGSAFKYRGDLDKKVYFTYHTASINDFLKEVTAIYTFDLPPLEGDANITMNLHEKKNIELDFYSNTLRYKSDAKTEHVLNDTMISLLYSGSTLSLEQYQTNYQEQKIFSNKPSLFTFQDGVLSVTPLWINDELNVSGRYNIKSQQGELIASADGFDVSHEKIDLKSRVNVKSEMQEGKTDIQGTVSILGGEIHHDMEEKTFSSDSDIINVEELKKRDDDLFMRNLSTFIKIDTEQPMVYNTKEADIKLDADLLIQKSINEPLGIFGIVHILKGSYYRIHNKKFVFKNSSVDFAGDPDKPILDITALYKTKKSEIMIHITGSHTDPNIVFSSIPHMSRKKILSTILFEVQNDNENMSEENMMLMMGDTMAQSVFSNAGGEIMKYVFSNIGINIDQLPFVGRSRDSNQSGDIVSPILASSEEDQIYSHNIQFIGQQYITQESLEKAMGVDNKSIFQFWKQDNPTINDRLLPTLQRSMQNYYESEGFYEASFLIETSKSDVIVNIEENQPVIIEDINISSDYDISELVTIKKGEIFKSKDFVNIKKNIIGKLMKEGYCSYDLDSKAYVDLKSHKVKVHFKLQKGDVCTFGKFKIKGLEGINDDVIISRIKAKEGEPFSTELIQETYTALYQLNAFDYISIKHDQKFYNVVPIEITGTEVERPWYFMTDVDYSSSDGFKISAGVRKTSLKGNAKSIGFSFSNSKIDTSYELNYFVPALFKISDHYFDFESKIGYSEFIYEGFTEEKGYVEALLRYNYMKWSMDLGLAIENIDIAPEQYEMHQSISSGNFIPVYPFFRFVYDHRDSRLDPKSGFYFAGEVEYGIPYDESKESSYLKYNLEGRALYTFKNITLSTVARAGIVEHDENEIPESKLFFAGGYETNRAYGYREIGVITSPVSYEINGASTMANLSFDASYSIAQNLYAEVFNDNTLLNVDSYDFSGDIISSVGTGVGYRTPLGQIILNIGMNIQDPSQYEINLHFGQSF